MHKWCGERETLSKFLLISQSLGSGNDKAIPKVRMRYLDSSSPLSHWKNSFTLNWSDDNRRRKEADDATRDASLFLFTLMYKYRLQATPWLSGAVSWGTKRHRIWIGRNRQFCPACRHRKAPYSPKKSPSLSNPYPWLGNLLEAPASQPTPKGVPSAIGLLALAIVLMKPCRG